MVTMTWTQVVKKLLQFIFEESSFNIKSSRCYIEIISAFSQKMEMYKLKMKDHELKRTNYEQTNWKKKEKWKN